MHEYNTHQQRGTTLCVLLLLLLLSAVALSRLCSPPHTAQPPVAVLLLCRPRWSAPEPTCLGPQQWPARREKGRGEKGGQARQAR